MSIYDPQEETLKKYMGDPIVFPDDPKAAKNLERFENDVIKDNPQWKKKSTRCTNFQRRKKKNRGKK